MTKAQKTEIEEAKIDLRKWIKPGDTVYTVLESVSRSGMSRQIRVVVPYVRTEYKEKDGTWTEGKAGAFDGREQRQIIDHLHPNYSVAKVIGARLAKKGDGMIVGGCGMDMGFHVVYELSHALYGGGYKCLGKGTCPSNYHSNHRDRVRCEGVKVGEDYNHCWKPSTYGFGSRRDEVPADWPRAEPIDIGDGQTIDGPLLSCIHTPDESGRRYVICPTCKGAGDLANPEGPQRFDLVHTDGYALRHKWL